MDRTMIHILYIIAAYALCDALGGVFHLLTDRGYNTKRVVNNFLKHHDYPSTMTFDMEPALFGVPIIGVGLYLSSVFLIALGVFVSFAQLPHYYTHFPAPLPVRVLQKLGIFVSPESHASHHNGVFDHNFCVTAGWSNWWINWIARKTQ